MAFTIAVLVASTACSPGPDEGWGIELAPELVRRQGMLAVDTGIRLELSPEAREALDHGVALVFVVTTELRHTGGVIPRLLDRAESRFEIRYLPLSRHWQLRESDSGLERNFPRFWMLEQALAEPRRFETGWAGTPADGGDVQLRIRAELDRHALPPPMHLPASLSPQWRLKSDWHRWQLAAA